MPEPDFDKRGGLLPAIAQDVRTGQVLMVAYMNRAAWQHTLATGKATYWSTSRNALWVKGETSGHVQHVRELLVDCDGDAVLLRVEQVGGVACHEGYASCFFRRVEGEDWRAQLLPVDRRPGATLPPRARAGDGALRRERHARRRHHGPRLGARGRGRRGGRAGAGLLEDEPPPDALGAGGGRRLARAEARGPARQA